MDINQFVLQHAWVLALVVTIISLHTVLKAWRDATDKTPETDDNAFERLVTVLGKVAAYLAGIRAK